MGGLRMCPLKLREEGTKLCWGSCLGPHVPSGRLQVLEDLTVGKSPGFSSAH